MGRLVAAINKGALLVPQQSSFFFFFFLLLFLFEGISLISTCFLLPATSEGNVGRCNALKANLATLEKLKEQYDAGVDVSAEVSRLRASMG